MGEYIVKFKKFDERTISGLVNKQVYYSTVYKLNDFGEFRFLSGSVSEAILDKDRSLVNEKLKDPFFVCALIQGLYQDARTSRDYIEKLKLRIMQGNIEDSDVSPIIEYIVFSSIGIFSASKIEIFSDDACRLMFAHYADANKGIALIYESAEFSNEIEYNNNLSLGSFGRVGRHHEWLEGNYNDIDDFLIKNEIWSYEREVRLLNKPGLFSFNDIGLKLKKILYTPLFDRRHILTLDNINKKIYNSELEMKEIIPAQWFPFKVHNDEQYIDVRRWLEINSSQ